MHVAAIIALMASFAAGWTLKQAQWDRSIKDQQESAQETARTIAARLADMASESAKVTERVTHEVKTNTVYRDCALPDGGARLLNDAISGEPTGDR
jgi:C4-dicarboxylate-specific signal transduction histidine kinase